MGGKVGGNITGVELSTLWDTPSVFLLPILKVVPHRLLSDIVILVKCGAFYPCLPECRLHVIIITHSTVVTTVCKPCPAAGHWQRAYRVSWLSCLVLTGSLDSSSWPVRAALGPHVHQAILLQGHT